MVAPEASAQPRGKVRPVYTQPFGIDPAEGDRVLQRVRHLRFGGDFGFQFELTRLPRRGEAQTAEGQLWGRDGADGQWLRVSAQPFADAESPTYVLRQGGDPAVWRTSDPGTELSADEVLAPLYPQIDYRLFDVLMPFLQWTDVVYEGRTREIGRTAHRFLFYPPEDFPETPAAIRLSVDAQFEVPVRVEFLDTEGEPLRTIKAARFQKVQDRWFVRQVDIRDEVTRDRLRMRVMQVAFDLDLGREAFDPAAAADCEPSLGPDDRWVRLGD
jgi:hypothetical protein